jgi:predicted glycosyltransferase
MTESTMTGSTSAHPARVLFQVRNRRGLGHLMRVRNIGAALRAHAPHLDLRFHASSRPAPGLWDADLPLSSDEDSSWTDRLAADRPDVVVYDTVLPPDPEAGLGPDTRCVLVLRRRLGERTDEVWSHPFLDRVEQVIVPHTAEEFGQPVPNRFAARTSFVGNIARRPDTDSRSRVRAGLGVADDALLLTSTVGGGGFQEQADRFFAVVAAIGRRLADAGPATTHVVVLGPNYAGDGSAALGALPQTVVRRFEPAMVDLLAASDLVVAEGGYNTVNEVRLGRVPAVFLPSQRGLDDQSERVDRLRRLGVAETFRPDGDAVAIADRVAALLGSPATLASMRDRYAGDRLVLGNERAAELIARVAS